MANFVISSVSGEPIAYINGANGKYDGKVKNPFVRYGRNSYSNFEAYCSSMLKMLSNSKLVDIVDFSDISERKNDNLSKYSKKEFKALLKKLDEKISSLDDILANSEDMRNSSHVGFVRRYLPEGSNYKNINPMALMGAAFEELGQRISVSVKEMNAKLKGIIGEHYSANSLDLNHDRKIDIAEYATAILAADMISKDDKNMKIQNINGTITSDGVAKSMKLFKWKQGAKSQKLFKTIYTVFNLYGEKCKFLGDVNNIQ